MMGVPTYPGRRKPTNDNQLLTAVNSSNNIESMVIILHLLASSILSCMYVPTLDAQRPEMIYTLFPKITLHKNKSYEIYILLPSYCMCDALSCRRGFGTQ